MTTDGRIGNLHYDYPIYTQLIQPNGSLTMDKECHACFYYTILAMKARSLHAGGIQNQIIEYRVGASLAEMPQWHESRDEEIARSVALIYGLESPDEFLKFKKEAWHQATQLGVNVEPAIYDVRPGIKRLN